MAKTTDDNLLPREPIHRLVDPVVRFMHVEAASGVLLLVCTAVALVLANSAAGGWYASIWKKWSITLNHVPPICSVVTAVSRSVGAMDAG